VLGGAHAPRWPEPRVRAYTAPESGRWSTSAGRHTPRARRATKSLPIARSLAWLPAKLTPRSVRPTSMSAPAEAMPRATGPSIPTCRAAAGDRKPSAWEPHRPGGGRRGDRGRGSRRRTRRPTAGASSRSTGSTQARASRTSRQQVGEAAEDAGDRRP